MLKQVYFSKAQDLKISHLRTEFYHPQMATRFNVDFMVIRWGQRTLTFEWHNDWLAMLRDKMPITTWLSSEENKVVQTAIQNYINRNMK